MSNLKWPCVLKPSEGNCPGGKCPGGFFFSRRELSGRELPGGELSAWGYCPVRSCPGELSVVNLLVTENMTLMFMVYITSIIFF